MTTSIDRQLWVRSFHPAPGAGSRLVCFPHAGGSASYFHPVSTALSPAVEVLAVQYPGRQDRRMEQPVDDLFTLADQLADVLSGDLDRPTAFFGHSMGASLAFEVARRLEERGTILTGLFVSGRRAPSAFRDERFHLKSDRELIAEVKRLSGTDSRLLDDEEVVRMVLPALRNDYKAAETYRYRPGSDVSCPVTALIGDADPKVSATEAGQWRTHTSGVFELRSWPGGHFYLNEHHRAVNRLIAERMAA